MNAQKLAEIFEKHRLWIEDEGGKRANLRGANLSGANLSGANLSGAKFLEIRTDIWTAQVHAETVRIGFQHHTHEAWMAFTDEEIAEIDDQALEWWRTYKPIIAAMIKAVKAQELSNG